VLVGFAGNRKLRPGERSDEEVLKDLGCTRILGSKFDQYLSDQILSYLREGDTLAVTKLDRIADKLDRLVLAVERLTNAGVAIRVDHSGIIPGTEYGENFVRACCVLAEFFRAFEQARDQKTTIRRRGRPHALDEETRARIDSALKEGGTDVLEIARSLKVSPATVYRHFRRKRAESPPAQQAPTPTKAAASKSAK
jgi:DNA invertase Pin-like site-specific DNA recombinase